MAVAVLDAALAFSLVYVWSIPTFYSPPEFVFTTFTCTRDRRRS